jgi:pyrroline-5-carboxylate reductase
LAEPDLIFAEPNPDQQQRLRSSFKHSRVVDQARLALPEAEYVVLALKPQVLKAIADELASLVNNKHLLVSIAAGISLPQLQAMLNSKRVIRVMPNTPAQVGAGAAAIAADDAASASDVAWVDQLMRSVGMAVRLPDHLMHAVTAISGSGPAYIYLVIEALSDGGVATGLPRDMATRLAAQTVLGAAKMVLETGKHPGQLKDQVTSPGGTTIAALRELEAAGVRSAFIEAVVACAERSQELA